MCPSVFSREHSNELEGSTKRQSQKDLQTVVDDPDDDIFVANAKATTQGEAKIFLQHTTIGDITLDNHFYQSHICKEINTLWLRQF